MLQYWDDVIEPLVAGLRPGQVMHFGAPADGVVAALAGAVAGQGGTLHVVTRRPGIDLAALRAAHGDRLVVHAASGADAVALMPVPDLVVIDDDPNWYTVHTLLNAVRDKAVAQARPLPVILVSKTGWPYARRDGYDDPASIPPAFRFGHERAGLRFATEPTGPGAGGGSALAGAFGLFADRYNGQTVNELRCGVQTAVEDFSGLCGLQIWHWPAFFGLSLLVAHGYAVAAVSPLVAPVSLTQAAARLVASVEAARVAALLEGVGARHAAGTANAHVAALRAALQAERAASAGLRRSLAERSGAGGGAGFMGMASPAGLLAAAGGRAGAATVVQPVLPEGISPEDLERVRQSPILNAGWYQAAYPQTAGIDPALHYLAEGAAAGNNPGPEFYSAYYLAANPDVAAAGLNPLLHYLKGGALEGRNPGPDFDSTYYLQANPDVAAAGHNPLEHYIRDGRGEGRAPMAPAG